MTLLVSDRALDDLAEILNYVRNDRPIAAEKLIERFWNEFDFLCKSPNTGHARADVSDERYRFKRVSRLSFDIAPMAMIC